MPDLSALPVPVRSMLAAAIFSFVGITAALADPLAECLQDQNCLARTCATTTYCDLGGPTFGSARTDPVPLSARICPDDRSLICVTGVNGLHTEYRFKADPEESR